MENQLIQSSWRQILELNMWCIDGRDWTSVTTALKKKIIFIASLSHWLVALNALFLLAA